MLFRPPAEHRLDAARNLLDDWNSEADRFRRAALAGRAGGAPSPTLLEAAHDARDGLIELLADCEVTLERTPAGHADFARLLQVQGTALALLESVAHSLDMLDDLTPVEASPPLRRVHHEWLAMN